MEKILDNFQYYIDDLVGLPVSLAWKGYGSQIYLEIGKLAPLNKKQNHRCGEACISIGWDWRVEKGSEILFGSSNSGPEINNRLKTLENAVIKSINITKIIPEIEVGFSNNLRLMSMLMLNDNPDWSIKTLTKEWVYPKKGAIYIGDGTSVLSEKEEARLKLSELAAKRWDVPKDQEITGNCTDCHFYAPIDGEGCLLDYGVCLNENSVFDGRIINLKSGCRFFVGINGT